MNFEQQLDRAEAGYLREPELQENKVELEEIAHVLVIYHQQEASYFLNKANNYALGWKFKESQDFQGEAWEHLEVAEDYLDFLNKGKNACSRYEDLEKIQEDINSCRVTLEDVRECGEDY